MSGVAAARAGESATPAPDRQELWVPANRLGEVLKNHPKAVLLSRPQYEKLLAEAAPKEPALNQPPRAAALVSAQYQGKVEGDVLTVEATLVVEVLAAEWARLPLPFGFLSLGEVQVEGEGTLALPALKKGEEQTAPDTRPATLLLRGKGQRKVTLRFTTPVATTDAWHGATVSLPVAGATSLVLDLPAHALATCGQPMRTEERPDSTRLTVALPADSGEIALRWRSSGGGLVALPLSVSGQTAFIIDADTLQARSDLTVLTATGLLPETLELALPADARLVEVTGSDVAGSTVEGRLVKLHLPPGHGSRVQFSTLIQRPTGLPPAGTEVALPLPELTGAGRVEGEFSVVAGAGVLVRELAGTPGTTPLPPVRGLAGHWSFLGAGVAPKIRVEPLRPRFAADLDTLIYFQPEAVFIERTVTLHPEEGGLYNLLISLPAGEEVLSVRALNAPNAPPEADPIWSVEGARLLLRWLGDPLPDRPRSIAVKTRAEPAGWAAALGHKGATATAFPFPVAEAKIEGAEKVSGYLALRSSENFRLEAEAGDTLEQRDGRTTPVTGTFAWFRRGPFDLKVGVTRRASELLATLTGYALPLAGVLDLHAQIAYEIRYSGVRSVQVRVPENVAEHFYFDGPQIAERTRAGDTWTLVFQKELTGPQVLSISAQIPVERAAGDAARFTTAVPVIEPLGVARVSGTWSVEANTDTEIQLTAIGMNEVDPLLAPPLAGYQPRHRVIGVFTWLGPQYTLSLAGVRHEGAGVLKTVVDTFDLASVVATTGVVRSQATLTLRTSGAQFLDVTLPAGARLLSLLVDDEPSKPVEGRPGDVRVQLPAKPDASAATALRLLYESAATPEWKARGHAELAPPSLPREVPVLRTSWKAWLPEGYYYSGLKNNFAAEPTPWERPLLLAPLAVRHALHAWKKMSVLGESGIADPRASEPANEWERTFMERFSRPQNAEAGGSIAPSSPNLAKSQNAIDALLFGGAGTTASSAPGTSRAPGQAGQNELQRTPSPAATPAPAGEPELRAKLEEIKQLSVEARAFLDHGRYDLAKKRCEQILGIEPYNIAARKMEEEIEQKKDEYAKSMAGIDPSDRFLKAYTLSQKGEAAEASKNDAAARQSYLEAKAILDDIGSRDPSWNKTIVEYRRKKLEEALSRVGAGGYDQTRSLSTWQAEKAWARPARSFNHSATLTQRTQSKLETIVIPKLEFREATIREAIEFLKQKSVALDTAEPDPARKGVNIVLALEGPRPGEPAGEEARITLSLSQIALGDALRYVANLAGLKPIVEDHAVRVVPLSTPTDIAPTNAPAAPPGGAISGVFTDPHFETVVRALNQKKVGGNLPVGGALARRVGLLPMHLDLPHVGEQVAVEGFGAPEKMEVRYFAHEARARRLWLLFLLGAAAYVFVGGAHPWWRTAWVALLLTAVPLCLSPAATTVCNLLLGGWLAAFVIARLSRRFIFAARPAAVLPEMEVAQ